MTMKIKKQPIQATLRLAAGALCLSLAISGSVRANEKNATSEVTGEIVGACTVAAENADFGQVPVSQAGTTIERTVNLTVNCSDKVNYKLFVMNDAPMEFTPNAGAGGGVQSVSLSFQGNTLGLTNAGAPIGQLSYWGDSSKTKAFDVGTSAVARVGNGLDQVIPVTIAWALPSAASLQSGSFGRFKVTNTYKVEF